MYCVDAAQLRQPQRRSPQVATNRLRPRPYPDEAGDFSCFSSSRFPLSPSGIRVTHGTSRPPGRRAVGSLTAIPSFLPSVRSWRTGPSSPHLPYTPRRVILARWDREHPGCKVVPPLPPNLGSYVAAMRRRRARASASVGSQV